MAGRSDHDERQRRPRQAIPVNDQGEVVLRLEARDDEVEPPRPEPKLEQSIRRRRHDRGAIGDVDRLATVRASMCAAIASESAMTSSASRTLKRFGLAEVRATEPTPLARSASSPSKCTAVRIPVARRIGTNGPFAGLNITTTSGRLRNTAWIVDTAVWVRVSSDFDRIAGRLTSSIPRYAVSCWPGFRQYTTTRWPYVARREPISSAAVSKPPYRAGTPRVPRSPIFNARSPRSLAPGQPLYDVGPRRRHGQASVSAVAATGMTANSSVNGSFMPGAPGAGPTVIVAGAGANFKGPQ